MVLRCRALCEKKASLLTMMGLTFTFFIAEIVTGHLTNSMALIADSFHMLSDVLSIMIGYIAVHFSDKTTTRNTYNWARAEILGALVNAVFLMALCFTIFVNAIQRLINVAIVEKPLVILGVGVAGIVVNLIGLVLFGSHAHAHHDHDHDSAGHSHSEHEHDLCVHEQTADQREILRRDSVSTIDYNNPATIVNSVDHERDVITGGHSHGAQLNMRAVFLHVLGDALGSLAVIFSALIIHFSQGDWRYYIDPAISLLIVIIISWTTIPLLKHAAMILLQNPPSGINLVLLREKVCKVPGVLGIHELHIWQLSSKCIIATAHIIMLKGEDFIPTAKQLKLVFHNVGIHATTIQPEFIAAEQTEQCTIASDNVTLHIGDNAGDISNYSVELVNPLSQFPGHSSSYGAVVEGDGFSDTTCLLSCVSDACQNHVCCPDGLKKRKQTSFENRSYIDNSQ